MKPSSLNTESAVHAMAAAAERLTQTIPINLDRNVRVVTVAAHATVNQPEISLNKPSLYVCCRLYQSGQ